MYTQCPHCESLFEVEEADLTLAAGTVCCGVCEENFNALENIHTELPEDTLSQDGFVEITLESRDLEDDEELEKFIARNKAQSSLSPKVQAQRVATLANDLILSTSNTRTSVWFLGTVILFLLATAQWVHINRHQLATHEKFSGLVTVLYKFMPAELTPLWDPSVLRVIKKLDLQYLSPSPESPGPAKLRARVTLLNMANMPVPYPNIWLQLDNDRNGGAIAQGMFSPQDYVGKHSWIEPNNKLDVVLDLVDPGNDATGFTWDICYPRKENWRCQFSSS